MLKDGKPWYHLYWHKRPYVHSCW